VGGDEFMVLMPATTSVAALNTAERCVTGVSASPIIINPAPVKITISAGISPVPSNTRSLEELMILTRDALHHSKEQGKNRASLSSLTE
jgi:diguanylate cyclase (GGDEF)-like protein